MCRLLSVLPLALFLAACNGDAPPRQPGDGLTTPKADTLPVMGQEKLMLLLTEPLIGGDGLGRDETYAVRLDIALRARGVNGRIIAIPGEISVAALSDRITALDAQPALVLISGSDAPPAGLPGLAKLGIPVHRLDLVKPLRGKPDLLQSGGSYPNARGVEEMVAATADEVVAALPQGEHPAP